MNETVAYLLAFQAAKGLGPKTLASYASQISQIKDDRSAYHLLEEIKDKYPGRIKGLPNFDTFQGAAEKAMSCLITQEKQGIHAISCTDKDFPSGFKDLDVPPLYIFYKGNKEALKQKGIAVIGTRNVTDYTQRVGEHIGSYMAKKGWSVVSGLALGSDASGHRGCLNANGTTVAIVATSLDRVYPWKNKPLQDEILAKGGCVVSEYPTGTPFIVQHLIARDRLQSGLAQGVFVVATGEKGGTWHAINEAVKLHKPICFYDYTKIKTYDYKKDEHTLGMAKMKSLGAKPIHYGMDIDRFLSSCKERKGLSLF